LFGASEFAQNKTSSDSDHFWGNKLAAENPSPEVAESLSVAPAVFFVWHFGRPGDAAELSPENS
tara:strand:- start:720 stop:911 length:192 start_codon:yes stop_codon:yes gene_type:complete